MTALRGILAAAIGLLLGAGAAWAEPDARVIRLQGTAEARQAAAAARPLAAGDPVSAGETLRTGPGSRLLLLFRDGMELTLSDGAEMTVADFRWDGTRADGAAALSMAEGSFLLRTGAVGKLPGHPLAVKTPVASVAVRGTQFWGGPLDNPLAVLLLEGRIVVTTPGGSVELGTPGEGTSVPEAGAPPRPPAYWSEEWLRRAFATVSFDG